MDLNSKETQISLFKDPFILPEKFLSMLKILIGGGLGKNRTYDTYLFRYCSTTELRLQKKKSNSTLVKSYGVTLTITLSPANTLILFFLSFPAVWAKFHDFFKFYL